ncbi:MAG TPA: helix-turn-helix domain-containing protein [Caulobacteraceae bacterium]|jgi:AcrR family transcriptional regulator
MNQMTLGRLSAVAPLADAEAERPNQRAAAKQRTREKILAAAKALFAERGYEAATIRDIAKMAGMSTGAVFASFTDKSDLFTEIAETEQVELQRAMRAAAEGLAGRAAILAMLEAARERQAEGPALFQAVMGALWTPGLADRVRRRLERRPVSALLVAAVHDELGGCAAAADVAFIAEMIWDGHLAVLRRAALGNVARDQIKTRIAEQVKLILAGARRR